MRIVVICEGKTEQAFKDCLHAFLASRLKGRMPALRFDIHNGPIPTAGKLKRIVETLLNSGRKPADAVIGLADVYPQFKDATDAKEKLSFWVGDENRFFPHAAQHEFEAWLIPYWDRIVKLAGHPAKPPGAKPEHVNHGNPPAQRIARLFESGNCRDSYNKPRDAKRILKDVDLMTAIGMCGELKAFVNTILVLSDPSQIIP